MTATMRFLTVAAAPLGSLAGGALATAIGLRATLLTIGVLRAAARRGGGTVVTCAQASEDAGGCGRLIGARPVEEAVSSGFIGAAELPLRHPTVSQPSRWKL